MPDIDRILTELGIELPEAPRPVAAYVPARRAGSLLFVSGQIPMLGGQLIATGAVPDAVEPKTAIACARQCALNALAVAKAELGTLDTIAGVIRLGVFVACRPEFTAHPQIANGASELMVQVFGEPGKHARAAVGCPSLPLGAPVEVEVTFAIK